MALSGTLTDRALTKTDLPGEPHHPARIYNYYCIHLKQAIQPAFVLDVTVEWDRKLAAVKAYESQFITGRPTQWPTFLDQLHTEAAYRGKAIGVKYGEPFTSREPIGLSSLAHLV
jgi:LmbE family N-acetylglucosaminyl deacetylase